MGMCNTQENLLDEVDIFPETNRNLHVQPDPLMGTRVVGNLRDSQQVVGYDQHRSVARQELS